MSDSSTTILGEQINQQNDSGSNDQKDFVVELVGEGKKYKTVEELAKAYVHADSFIETLKREKQELATQHNELLTKAKTVEDVLEALQINSSFETPSTTTTATVAPVTNTPTQFSQEDIAKLLDKELKEREELKKIKENQDKSWVELSKLFGTKEQAVKVVSEYIGSNEIRKETIQKLGSYDPEALLDIFKPLANNSTVSFVDEPSVIISNFNNGSEQLTWKKANEVKKANPKLYNTPSFQQQIHRAASQNPNFWK